jgi:hypothetical protein
MPRPVRALLSIALAIAFASCGGSPDAEPSPSPLPSGVLGVVTPEAAREAVEGLCDIAGETDRDAAATIFFDRSHQTLHVVAAATEVVDRTAAANLLIAKQAVEEDLRQPILPNGFAGDVEVLLGALREALATIGLDAPACET